MTHAVFQLPGDILPSNGPGSWTLAGEIPGTTVSGPGSSLWERTLVTTVLDPGSSWGEITGSSWGRTLGTIVLDPGSSWGEISGTNGPGSMSLVLGPRGGGP